MTFSHPVFLGFTVVAVSVVALVQVFVLFRARHDIRLLLHEQNTRAVERVLVWKWAISTIFLILSTGSVGVSLAGPEYGTREIERNREGLDVSVVVDVSRSMYASDVEPDRLSAAREFVVRLLSDMASSRFGLSVFRGEATRVLPLTHDTVALQYALQALSPDMITAPGTGIASGIRAGVEALPRDSNRYGVLLLLTDGESLSGSEEAAATMAFEARVPIVTVGVGSEEAVTITLPSGELVRDSSGEVVETVLDEENLRRISELTDGLYVRIGEPDSYELVRRFLSRHSAGEAAFTEEKVSRSVSFAGLAVFFLFLYLGVRVIRWRNLF